MRLTAALRSGMSAGVGAATPRSTARAAPRPTSPTMRLLFRIGRVVMNGSFLGSWPTRASAGQGQGLGDEIAVIRAAPIDGVGVGDEAGLDGNVLVGQRAGQLNVHDDNPDEADDGELGVVAVAADAGVQRDDPRLADDARQVVLAAGADAGVAVESQRPRLRV